MLGHGLGGGSVQVGQGSRKDHGLVKERMALVHRLRCQGHLHTGCFQAPDQFLIGGSFQVRDHAFGNDGTDVVNLGQFFGLRFHERRHLAVMQGQDAAAFGAYVADAQGE